MEKDVSSMVLSTKTKRGSNDPCGDVTKTSMVGQRLRLFTRWLPGDNATHAIQSHTHTKAET